MAVAPCHKSNNDPWCSVAIKGLNGYFFIVSTEFTASAWCLKTFRATLVISEWVWLRTWRSKALKAIWRILIVNLSPEIANIHACDSHQISQTNSKSYNVEHWHSEEIQPKTTNYAKCKKSGFHNQYFSKFCVTVTYRQNTSGVVFLAALYCSLGTNKKN